MGSLPQVMQLLQDELRNIHLTITSDYSPDLAEALARGRLTSPSCARNRNTTSSTPWSTESSSSPMPSDHRLTAREAVRPQDFLGEIFIGGSNKACRLRAVTEAYLRHSGLDITPDHGVDNMAMAMSLVASTRGLALMPAYAQNLMPQSVVSRPLDGEALTIEVAVGHSKSNSSPILKLLLSRLDDPVQPNQTD